MVTVTRRGFTLVELMIALAITGLLVGVGAVTYSAVQKSMQGQSAAPAVASVQLEVRRIMLNQGLTTFPADIATRLDVKGITITTSTSSNANTVSVYRRSGTELVLAAGTGGGCLAVLDKTVGAPVWAKDKNTTTCSAFMASPSLTGLTGGTALAPVTMVIP